MTESKHPWYREPMVWLLIALPAVVIAGTVFAIVLATRAGGGDAFPSAVRRTAQIQADDLAPDRKAIALDLHGSLSIDPSTGAVWLALENLPASTLKLHLDLIHPARAAEDMSTDLVRAGENFAGRIENATGKVWSVLVSDAESTWSVTGRFDPATNSATLAPALSEAN